MKLVISVVNAAPHIDTFHTAHKLRFCIESVGKAHRACGYKEASSMMSSVTFSEVPDGHYKVTVSRVDANNAPCGPSASAEVIIVTPPPAATVQRVTLRFPE